MIFSEDEGDFHGTTINFRDEYFTARRLMEMKGTDLILLAEKVSLLYRSAAEKWELPYLTLLNEIQRRATMNVVSS